MAVAHHISSAVTSVCDDPSPQQFCSFDTTDYIMQWTKMTFGEHIFHCWSKS